MYARKAVGSIFERPWAVRSKGYGQHGITDHRHLWTIVQDPGTKYRSNRKEYRTDQIERLPRFSQKQSKCNSSPHFGSRLFKSGSSLFFTFLFHFLSVVLPLSQMGQCHFALASASRAISSPKSTPWSCSITSLSDSACPHRWCNKNAILSLSALDTGLHAGHAAADAFFSFPFAF